MDIVMPKPAPILVTSTDWFKVFGIAAFLIDHIGLFFFPDDEVLRVLGRIAAPIFFFFVGFARTRSFPVSWLVWGIILTGMDWWTDRDLTLNILLSFLAIRLALRWVDRVATTPLQLGYFVLASLLLLPFAGDVFEYGAEGWLWALFGFAQRAWRDDRLDFTKARIVVAFLAAFAYAFVEIEYHDFEGVEATGLAVLVLVLTLSLLAFNRTISTIQPPRFLAAIIVWTAHYSLEIYAISLFLMQDLVYVFQ